VTKSVRTNGVAIIGQKLLRLLIIGEKTTQIKSKNKKREGINAAKSC
jgi:hypothetical protein